MREKKQQGGELGESELRKIKGLLSKRGISVPIDANSESVISRGFGTSEDGVLVLSSYEALFLQSKEVLEVSQGRSSKTLDFQELLHRFEVEDESVWVKYLIYRDLRSRGYVVREGFGLGIDFRVYERGEYGKATAPYLILGIQEGKPISMKDLANVLKHVQSLKKKLVLAVVNRRGEIVYYTLSKLTMKK